MYENRPWLRFYGKVPSTLAYPEVTLYEAVAATALRVPAAIAWDFFGTRSTYAQLLADVDRCAAALAAAGVREGDRFLISMPTCPQAVIAFYAANRLGALPALIHPLATASEITLFLDISGARMALTLDAFYGPLAAATPATPLERIVVARVAEYLPPLKRLGFWVAKGRKTNKDLKVGICGEHGGDPASVDFCHRAGLNYVSCSPFRVPIARLAAAQAAIKHAK